MSCSSARGKAYTQGYAKGKGEVGQSSRRSRRRRECSCAQAVSRALRLQRSTWSYLIGSLAMALGGWRRGLLRRRRDRKTVQGVTGTRKGHIGCNWRDTADEKQQNDLSRIG